MDIHNVILKAIVTEKTMKESEKGKYTFLVAAHAHKDKIKQAVEKFYNVSVIGVSTLIVKGKTRRLGVRRAEVTLSAAKKAIVRLKKGQALGGSGTSEDKKDKDQKKK